MIAAAKADGHIDEEERKKIADKLTLVRHRRRGRAFLLRRDSRGRSISTSWSPRRRPTRRSVELYTASRLAIEPDSRAERGYLDLLAGRLQLPDALVDHVEATVSQATSA